jgi:hypothetical protein|eukprot:COSAG01_NODE_2844_length_6989_cov_41.950943_4_plen_59_part_00
MCECDSVGVMVIITLEIVKRDIVPFLAFAVITLACFETASFFFFWFLDGTKLHYAGES